MRRLSDLSTRELRKISAYLDGELTPQEANVFERLLKEDLELAQALEEIRQTKKLLAELPQRRAPRNFTLTPDMLGIRQTRAPALLRYATVITMLAFTFLVGTDVLFNMTGSVLDAAAPAMEAEFAMETAGDMVLEEAAPAESGDMMNAAGGEMTTESEPVTAMEMPEGEMPAAEGPAPLEMPVEEQVEADQAMEALAEAPGEEVVSLEAEEEMPSAASERTLESAPSEESEAADYGVEDSTSDESDDEEGLWKASGDVGTEPQADDSARSGPCDTQESGLDRTALLDTLHSLSLVRVVEIVLGIVALAFTVLWARSKRRG